MRRFTVLISSVLALMIGVPAAAAFAGTAAAPAGALESVVSDPVTSSLILTGWAVDPGTGSAATAVRVTVDGATAVGWRDAAVPRPDLKGALSVSGDHGFAITFTPLPGKHAICVDTRLRSGGQVKTLGCFSFEAFRMATAADMTAIASVIDPQQSMSWQWKALPAGTLGSALPWNGQIIISSLQSMRNLRDVMLHEWSHVLQYRAFGGSWADAVQAFTALLSRSSDGSAYAGIEHGADCIAQALGAQYQGYGCWPELRVYGSLIARGVLMTNLQGAADVTASRSTVSVTGWVIDPAAPTTSTTFVVTDNGQEVTKPVITTVTRADANTATGVTGVHGFSAKMSLPAGKHRICVSGQFVKSGKSAVIAGTCTTMTTS